MALPVTISGVTFGINIGGVTFQGPFISSAGNVYVVLHATASNQTFTVQKATDPTDSFTEVLSQSAGQNCSSLSAIQDGDDLHIAVCKQGTDSIVYSVFDMSSDTLTTTNEDTTATLTLTDAEKRSSIAIRSDGDIVLLYSGRVESI